MSKRQKKKAYGKDFFSNRVLVLVLFFIFLLLAIFYITGLYRKILRTGTYAGVVESTILLPTDDSYVNQKSPTRNYGTSKSLNVSTNPEIAYLKFDLSSLSGLNITGAKLRLHKTGRLTETPQYIQKIEDVSWLERVITYNTKPAEDASAVKYNGVLSGEWIDYDLGGLVKATASQKLSLIVRTASAKLTFNSKESSTKPKLIVDYMVEPPPSTPTPTPLVTPTITPTPVPTVPGGGGASGSGFWISRDEVLSRAMSGLTWDQMKKVADGDVGAANMSDQDSTHPEKTLGLALVAVRTGDSNYLNKAANELVEAIGTEKNTDPNCTFTRTVEQGGPAGARSLAVARNLLAYVVAADVMDFRDGGFNPDGKGKMFQDWVNYIRYRDNCPNNGSGAWPDGNWYNLSQVHDVSTSNGDALAGGARIAAAAYLGDRTEIDKAWLTYRRYAGDRSVGPTQSFNSGAQSWIYNLSAPVGINPKGSTCHDTAYPADGVIPNDQGRGGACPTDPTIAPAYTQYPWEGLQGAYAQALMLARLGYKDSGGADAWHVSDNAMLRAVQYQWYLQSKFGGLWYDAHRASWVKHLANYVYGYKPTDYEPYGGGRNMDWTQWTHQ